MSESRVKNSAKNLFYSYIGQIINILLKFALRSYFIRVLTTEYLGLNGLFGNILSFLSLAELGIGGAITYNLYVEIANQNTERIKQLMRLYKTAYVIIGCFVLLAGSSLIPFLDFFIEGKYEIPNIRLIYFLFVLNSGSSYFFSYKANFIIANQKNYIVTNINLVSNIVIAILQTLSLFLFNSYIAYLIVQVIITFGANVVMAFIADKRYPILKEKVTGKLDENSKHIITQNVSAAVFHKVGGIIVFSTDNILLSKLFGLIQVGLYSNYTLITKTLQALINQFFVSITASVGNLCAAEGNEKKVSIFYITEYINFLIFSFSSICIYELLEKFITLWLGKEYLMNNSILCLLALNFYLEGMRSTLWTFNGSMGLARYYKYMPIPEVIINLGSSIILGRLFGPVGIFIGTTLSTVFTCWWIEPKVLFKYGLDSSLKKYYYVYFKYFFITILNFIIVHFTNKYITFEQPVITFVVHIIICGFMQLLLLVLLTFKSEEFKYLMNLLFKKKQVK
ncbi:MAG: oligosaccharide flippase family protein [Treponema sp.]|nr:oligosaccharide flippase family protein [Treponema sp.]